MVAIGTVEAVLLAPGIEMSAGGFEVRGIALGILVKVDGVLAGRQVVKVKLEADSGFFIPQHDCANGFALRIFEFDFCFGGCGECDRYGQESC